MGFCGGPRSVGAAQNARPNGPLRTRRSAQESLPGPRMHGGYVVSAYRSDRDVCVADAIGGAVRIRRLRPRVWSVVQRSVGDEHDNNHAGTWLRITNHGPAVRIGIHLKWAEFRWMALRKLGYLKQGRRYRVIRGCTTPTKTVYEFSVPRGTSHFGGVPWYSNEDADRFFVAMRRRSPECEVRTIGASAEGREIRCLTMAGRPGRRARKNVVILARMHATETAGSFAVEATARHLLGPGASDAFLRDCTFHLFPVVNPDGVAHGIKLTQLGPVDRYDMERAAMTSGDPTVAALWGEVLSLRPHCLIDHHSYLFQAPMVYFLDRRVGFYVLQELIQEDPERKLFQSWAVHQSGALPGYLRDHCHAQFNTTVMVTELPWQGRLPSEVGELGVQITRAALRAASRPR